MKPFPTRPFRPDREEHRRERLDRIGRAQAEKALGKALAGSALRPRAGHSAGLRTLKLAFSRLASPVFTVKS